MVEASLLIKIPSSIGCAIIGKWLSARSWGRLDVAYCNKRERTSYLELLHCCGPIDPATSVVSKYFGTNYWSIVRWVNDRHIKCSAFHYCQCDTLSAENQELLEHYLNGQARMGLNSVCIRDQDETATPLILEILIKYASSLSVLQVPSVSLERGKWKWNAALKTVLRNSANTLTVLHVDATAKWRSILEPGVQFPALNNASLHFSKDADLITVVCSAAPNLTTLRILSARCTGNGIGAIGKYCHNLEVLVIDSAGPVDFIDKGFAAIAQGCPQLRTVTAKKCTFLTNVGVTAIVTHCTQLEELHVVNNMHMTDASLIALAHTNSAHFKYLDISGCTRVAGPGLVAIASHCPQFYRLDVGGTRDPSVSFLKLAIPFFENVRVLYASDLAVDDEMLQQIADHMPQLEELNMEPSRYAPTFTSEGVDRVVSQCEKLRFLNVGFRLPLLVEDVDPMPYDKWRAMRPGLKIGSLWYA